MKDMKGMKKTGTRLRITRMNTKREFSVFSAVSVVNASAVVFAFPRGQRFLAFDFSLRPLRSLRENGFCPWFAFLRAPCASAVGSFLFCCLF